MDMSSLDDIRAMLAVAVPRVNTAVDLGMLVRARRRERALSQQELADRVGVSRQWVVAVEKGKPRAELALLLRTLSALDLSLSIDPRPEDEVDLDALIERARGRGP